MISKAYINKQFIAINALFLIYKHIYNVFKKYFPTLLMISL